MNKIIAPPGHIRLFEAMDLSKFINNHVNNYTKTLSKLTRFI